MLSWNPFHFDENWMLSLLEKHLLLSIIFLSILNLERKLYFQMLYLFSLFLLLWAEHLPLHLYSCILILVNQRCRHSCLYQILILSVWVCVHMEVKIQAFYKYNSNILWESNIWNSSGLESTQLHSVLLTVLASCLTLPLFSPQLTVR